MLIIFSNNQVYNQVDSIVAKLVNISNVDVCGGTSDREVIFYIDIGKIYPGDSLIGYNFEVRYDSTKLRFHTGLFGNTLTEFFEIKEVSFIHKGLILGYGANFSFKPVYGERPLVAILGDYIGNCEDTTTLIFSFIEFNDEFKKSIKSYENAVVVAKVKIQSDRFLKCVFEKPSITIPSDSLFEIKVKLKSNPIYKIWKQNFVLEGFDGVNLTLNDISSVSDKVWIYDITNEGNRLLIKTEINSFIDDEEVFTLVFQGNKVNEKTITMYPIKTDSCNCISFYIEDSCKIVIKDKDTNTTSINDFIDEYMKVSYIYNGIAIESPNDELIAIKLIDVLGRVIVNERLDRKNYCQVNFENNANGVFFLIINTLKGEKIIKLININN